MTLINGYDAEGGLWFSRWATSPRERTRLVERALALPEVVHVAIEVWK